MKHSQNTPDVNGLVGGGNSLSEERRCGCEDLMFHNRGIISLTFEHQTFRLASASSSSHRLENAVYPNYSKITLDPPRVKLNPSRAGPDVPKTAWSDPFLSPGRGGRPRREGGILNRCVLMMSFEAPQHHSSSDPG